MQPSIRPVILIITLLLFFGLIPPLAKADMVDTAAVTPPPDVKTKLQIRLSQQPNIDIKTDIYFSLLELALQKSGHPYEIKITPVSATTHFHRIITHPDLVNIGWIGTSKEIEAQLLPVRIPLLRGMVGYRVFLIRKEDQPIWNEVKTLDNLAQFKALLGRGWSDVAIMRAKNLPVVEGIYTNLVSMLMSSRGDYYPRSIFEINQQLDETRYPTVGIEQSLLLHYPLAIYFFVAPGQIVLRDALQNGLERAMADGSYNELLATHPMTQNIFKTLNLPQRHLIEIDNPFLTDDTRAALARYGVNPQRISSIRELNYVH
ncbi:hypothetical protein [Thiofilum flexile]|uniref:hypothetical protein n=1 Tax=Thiofilum flexile TaxID=125627 RepID=UPI000362D7E6|nr:hypothetical protein [Thiofilum flexile]